MFEKEAEDSWQSKDLWYKVNADESAYKTGFQDGYNKAFVEADKNLKAIVTDFNRANEWHYPSKGEYPKECENVLCYCYCKGTEIKFCCVGHIVVGGDNKARWWSNNKTEELRVIAWKEIVLPKEIKEMTKDEMKDKISMALKDTVLQQGFEIICKENAELEKEKCELLGIIQGKDEVIANLKEQSKDLCESLDIMNNRESELLDQIVKMKNRLNCTKYHYCLCNDKTCKTCKDWELEK